MNHQSRFDAGYRKRGAGALGWPRGMGWWGRWEGGSGWGTRVQAYACWCMAKPIQYCKVKNILKNNIKKILKYLFFLYLLYTLFSYFQILKSNALVCLYNHYYSPLFLKKVFLKLSFPSKYCFKCSSQDLICSIFIDIWIQVNVIFCSAHCWFLFLYLKDYFSYSLVIA